MNPSNGLRGYTVGLLLIICAAVLSSCSEDGSDGISGPSGEYWARLYDWSDPATWPDPAGWPDNKLRSFAYSRHWGHPDFYQEDSSRGSVYYENTISTGIEHDQWIELCTSDRDSAFAWSETSAGNSAYYRELESELETDKYFEFRRVYAAHPSDVILSRVHKFGYLNRSMFDHLDPTAVIGVFNVRPISPPAARELIEYMWVNGMIIDFGRPITRDVVETETSIVEEIYYSYTVGGDWGTCDTIHLERARVQVNKATGEITYDADAVRAVSGVCYDP